MTKPHGSEVDGRTNCKKKRSSLAKTMVFCNWIFLFLVQLLYLFITCTSCVKKVRTHASFCFWSAFSYPYVACLSVFYFYFSHFLPHGSGFCLLYCLLRPITWHISSGKSNLRANDTTHLDGTVSDELSSFSQLSSLVGLTSTSLSQVRRSWMQPYPCADQKTRERYLIYSAYFFSSSYVLCYPGR